LLAKAIVGQADSRQGHRRLHLARALARPPTHHDALDPANQMGGRRCQVADGFHRPVMDAAQLLSREVTLQLLKLAQAAASAGAP
jgi:hypothetical protein